MQVDSVSDESPLSNHTLPNFGCILMRWKGFSGGSVVKNLPANAEDAGSNPGLGRSLGVGSCNLLQYSCLENSMDRGSWWAVVHRVTKSQT